MGPPPLPPHSPPRDEYEMEMGGDSPPLPPGYGGGNASPTLPPGFVQQPPPQARGPLGWGAGYGAAPPAYGAPGGWPGAVPAAAVHPMLPPGIGVRPVGPNPIGMQQQQWMAAAQQQQQQQQQQQAAAAYVQQQMGGMPPEGLPPHRGLYTPGMTPGMTPRGAPPFMHPAVLTQHQAAAAAMGVRPQQLPFSPGQGPLPRPPT